MGVKNIRWHMVSCVDDRGRGRVGVVDSRRKKGRKVASLSVLSLVNPQHYSTLQSSSGGILRGWESMFKLLFRDKEVEMYVLIFAMVLME